MDKLTPSAQRTLDALNAGPGNVHELAERTGRSRSTTDRAIADLAKADLIVKVDDGGDPADGAPARWQLAVQPSDGDQTTEPDKGHDITTPDADAPADTASTAGEVDAAATEAVDAAPEQPITGPSVTDPPVTDAVVSDGPADGEATANSGPTSGGETTPAGQATSHRDGEQTQAEAPKLCRGCQAQMPKICQCCWQKTPAYCGKCRRDMPQARRGEPGEPVILSNGLPKLRPGELEELILKVMREQPLPRHTGIVGWTGGRVAVFLPGRSPSAINNALEKFTRKGVCELIGDKPMRYQLKHTEDAANDTNTADADTSTTNTVVANTNTAGADSAESMSDAQAEHPDTGTQPTTT